MNKLINITLNENHEPVVSARDLHKGLEISKRFSAWFEQNSKLFIENEEFTSVPKGTPVIGGNGNIQYLDDFALTQERLTKPDKLTTVVTTTQQLNCQTRPIGRI